MFPDYYKGFEGKIDYKDTIIITPDTTLFIPVRPNLRAEIDSDRNLILAEYASILCKDREIPGLFHKDNLIYEKNGTYIFKTNYVTDPDKILSIEYIYEIPRDIRERYIRKAPYGINELADHLIGTETDTLMILQKFYNFVRETIRYEITNGKKIQNILEEYENTGIFHGNCKEARDLIMTLCDSIGYPSKSANGKCRNSGGHVWPEIFVPTKEGHGIFPVDAALGHFGTHDPMDHIFFEQSPKFDWEWKLIGDFFQGNTITKDYNLTIEQF